MAAGTWLDQLYGMDIVRWFGWLNVWAAVVLMIVRGLPVILDAAPYLTQNDAATPPAPGRGDR